MAFHLTKRELHLQPGAKIIKADQYATFIEARDILRKAKEEAELILDEAHQEFKEQKHKGFENGALEGKTEMIAQLFENVQASIENLGQLEGELVELVGFALKKIIGEMDAGDRIVSIVKTNLERLKSCKKVTVRVAPAETELILAMLREKYNWPEGTVAWVDVIGDYRVKAGNCVLETEIGVVYVNPELQIEDVKRVISGQFSKDESKQ